MKKLNKKIKIGAGLSVFFILAMLAFMNTGINMQDLGSITTYTKSEMPVKGPFYLPVKIILEKTKAISDALFDIILTIPEKSKEIISGEDLLVSIELINFGGPGETDVSINYIITNSEGDIVLIEHEKRIVETQASFLKEIDLPDVMYGDYKLFVELLYSNTSAIATEEFKVI